MKRKDYDSAKMAVIAAGTCSRYYNSTGCNPKKSGSVFKELIEIRKTLSHIDFTDTSIRSFEAEEMMKRLEEEIKSKDNVFSPFLLNIGEYTKEEKSIMKSDESPRALEKTAFKFK